MKKLSITNIINAMSVSINVYIHMGMSSHASNIKRITDDLIRLRGRMISALEDNDISKLKKLINGD